MLDQLYSTAAKCGNLLADEAKLHRVKHCMIRMMCGVRLVDRVPTDVLRDRIGVLVKIKDTINQSCLPWYGHEEGSTKEIVRTVCTKERFGMI